MMRIRPLLTAALLLALIALLAPGGSAAEPPGLPASFYGEVNIDGYIPSAATILRVYLDTDASGAPDVGEPLVASTALRQIADPVRWVYTVDVPEGPCTDGSLLAFELSQPPTASDDGLTVAEDSLATAVTVPAAEGLGAVGAAVWTAGTNTRQDLAALFPYGLELSISVGPSHGSATVSGGKIAYTPAKDYCGSDALTYTVTDRDAASASASIAITVTCVNDAPTDLRLSNASVAEGLPAGSAVGTLSVTDVDAGDAQTYTLVPIPDSDDHSVFQIVGDALQTSAVLDHDAQSTYIIRVRATDTAGAWVQADLTITVIAVNARPTDITLSPATVPENAPVGTAVGTLSTSDTDVGDTHTYSLVLGEGAGDNASFAIDGSTLRTAETFDYEARAEYHIRVETDDGHPSGTFAKALTVTVTNVNEAPVIAAIPGQVITQTGSFTEIDLNDYVSDPDSDLVFTWSHSGATALSVSIADGVATLGRALPGWDGLEEITFTAADTGGLQGSATVAFRVLARQSIALVPGWNLVGFGLIPQQDDTATVLESIAGQFDLVYAWDAATAGWLLYDADPEYPNAELSQLDRSQGLWVHATAADAVLTIDGIAEGNTVVPIHPDAWHLVSYPSGVEGALPGALRDNGLADGYSVVYAYHAEDTADPWKLHDPAGPAWANDLAALAPGRGYWLRSGSTSGLEWIVTHQKAPLP